MRLFYGIIIWMCFGDHAPLHVHAEYGDDEALIMIGSGHVYDGSLPRRALRLVQEWEELYRAELPADWDRARAQRPLTPIAPLR